MISFPFDSVVTYEEDGTPIYDRGADSTILAQFFSLMFSDGVFAIPEDGLLVTAPNNNMSVVVKPGNCVIQGRMAIESYDRILMLEASDTGNDRIDSVVARLNTNYEYRNIDLYVKKGIAVSSPVPPELTRAGGIYEIRLANISIPSNSTIIMQNRITDTRKVDGECGIAAMTPDRVLYYQKAEIEAMLRLKQDVATAINTGNIAQQSVSNTEKVNNSKFVTNYTESTYVPLAIWGTSYSTAGGATAQTSTLYDPKVLTVGHATSADSATNADTVDGKHADYFQAHNDTLDSVINAWSTVQSNANSAVQNDSAYATLKNNVASAYSWGSGALQRSGGTMTGNVSMGNHEINNISALRGYGAKQLYVTTDAWVEIANHVNSSRMDILINNLHYAGELVKDSYRGVKENEREVPEEQIRKILDVPVKLFDYRPGFSNGRKNVVGAFTDEVQDVIPEAVVIPDGWSEEDFNELLGDMGNESVPGIDYTVFIPYLIGMVQLQEKELGELKQQIAALDK